MLYTLAYTVLVKGWSHLAGKMKCQNLIATVLHTQYSLVTITKKSNIALIHMRITSPVGQNIG